MLLAATRTDTRTSKHSKFNFPLNCDVHNCQYAPKLLIKSDLHDGKNFRVTKGMKNMSYGILAVSYAVDHVTLRSDWCWQRRVDRVLLIPVRFSGLLLNQYQQICRIYLYREYLQVVWPCPCWWEVSKSMVLLPELWGVCVSPLRGFHLSLLSDLFSVVIQANGRMDPRGLFQFGLILNHN